MIRFITALIFIAGIHVGVSAQSARADEVSGTYWNAEKTSHIQIYRAINGKYYGKIVYLKQPNDKYGLPKTDPENPNKSLRSRKRLGMLIMHNFAWNASESRWDNGTLYDPVSGSTYDGYMYFKGSNRSTLYLRGYVMGMTWLGRTSEWTRIK